MTMECNKDEAIRAKDIAEKKMQSKDFGGAKKILLKAQQLFPGLDNISQLLAVCEVHCSVGVRVNGETDWYGILQVELTADESTIRKQYRKLALLLHPDKNKFAGAEAAFKLIGEAHMTLSDPTKRSIHDMKRKSNIRSVPSRQPSQPSNRTSYGHVNGVNQPPPAAAFSGTQTFWTSCSLCGMRYQYYLSILNKPIRCQQCMQPFIAYDLNAGVNTFYPRNHSEATKQGFPGQPGSAPFSTGLHGDLGGGSTTLQPSSRSGIKTKHRGGSTDKMKEDNKVGDGGAAGSKVKLDEETPKGVTKREKMVKPSAGSTGQKKGRKTIDCSDSDSVDSELSEGIIIEENGNPKEQYGSYYPRRSSRQKKDVSYNEDEIDDGEGFVSPPSSKRLRKGGSSSNAVQSDKTAFEGEAAGVKVQSCETVVSDKKIDNKYQGDVAHKETLPNGNKPALVSKSCETAVKVKAKASSNTDSQVASSLKNALDFGLFTYPDPEFYDFEKGKDASQFSTNQIWAVYDDLDGMPRFYARIRGVCTQNFKVRFTWLEYNPVGQAELAWSEEELPVACGNYVLGKSESTRDRLMFSHLMYWEKGMRRGNSYDIYPRKGEVWALLKGWDMSWSSDAGSHRLHEYEVVEVLSDCAEAIDISVIPLVRVKGFVSLFMRPIHNRRAPLPIPSGEVLRFSHKVPSYRLMGSERGGVPEGSFELDPASLPTNFEAAFPAVNISDGSGLGICFESATSTEIKGGTHG